MRMTGVHLSAGSKESRVPSSSSTFLGALASYSGAVVLVSHDEGAVEALNPERVLILPDGIEDHWNKDYAELISLA